jgi:hypothetical protein
MRHPTSFFGIKTRPPAVWGTRANKYDQDSFWVIHRNLINCLILSPGFLQQFDYVAIATVFGRL